VVGEQSLALEGNRTYVRLMERLHELERMRRSIAMLQPGTKALDREEAMMLISEIQDLERRMGALREALTGVLEGREKR
jgi:hypothetical protein